jgi:membrane protein
MMSPRSFWQLIKSAFAAWRADHASSKGAALAYYSLFSIAPILIIAIAVAAFFFGEEAARGEILTQLRGLLGDDGATAVQALLASASRPTQGIVAAVSSIALLVVGATTVFAELQVDLDLIWKAPAAKKKGGLWALLRARVLSFGVVLALGLLLLISLVVSAGLAAMGRWWGGYFEGWDVLLEIANFVFSIAVTTALFAMIYKLLPSVEIAWRDVWIGAIVTALFFALGKTLIGLYLGHSGVASGFGAAGSFVVLLLWVYYSTQIFLLGAEFTGVYAREYGSHAHRAGSQSTEQNAPASRSRNSTSGNGAQSRT